MQLTATDCKFGIASPVPDVPNTEGGAPDAVRHTVKKKKKKRQESTGFEPVTFRSAGGCSKPLS